LHPEKQFFDGNNAELEAYSKSYSAVSLTRWWRSPYISDIGVPWRLKEGLTLTYKDGSPIYKKL
jgi:hypothetical protein